MLKHFWLGTVVSAMVKKRHWINDHHSGRMRSHEMYRKADQHDEIKNISMDRRRNRKREGLQTVDCSMHRQGVKVLEYLLLLTHRSPGLNSRENLVLFFLCFLFKLRMESGMLFFRFVPRPPLWEEAVELADDVRELQPRLQWEIKYSQTTWCFLITRTVQKTSQDILF